MKKGLTCLENRSDSDVKPVFFVVILLMPRFELTTEAEGIQKFQNRFQQWFYCSCRGNIVLYVGKVNHVTFASLRSIVLPGWHWQN